MKTLTNYPKCLEGDDQRFLTSFKPAETDSFYPDTCLDLNPQKEKKGMRIFLVDDDLMYLTAMEYYLSMEFPSLNIKTFQTGESSLLEMEQHPDIVVLDYYLDSVDTFAQNGISVLKKIKNLYPETKVIMLSCQDDIKIAMDSIKNGASEYVSKGQTAFVRIKNILVNMALNINVLEKFERKVKIIRGVNLLLLIILILFYLLSHFM